jgi:hypothetical protein
MKTKWWLTLVLLSLAASLPLSFISCSSGGGGGTSPTSTYTGETKLATIAAGVVEENAWDFALDTWVSVDLGIIVLQQMAGILEMLAVGIPSPDAQGSIEGPCGGTVTFSGSVDEAGEIMASVEIENFCAEGIILKGSATLSGSIDPGTNGIERYTLIFKSVTFTVPDEGSFTLDGTFSVDFTTLIAELSYILKTSTSETYWFDVSIEVDIAEGLPYTYLTGITGRYYDYYNGYVQVSVGEQIVLPDEDYWPVGGTLIVTGAGGTKARLEFLPNAQYSIDADTNGDGQYDYFYGTFSWDDKSEITTLKDPYIFSENVSFSDFFASSGLVDSYFMRAIVKSDSPGSTMYIEGGPVYEQIPYIATIDLLFAPYYLYLKTFMPPYDPPGTSWEGIEYTFFADENVNGMIDPGEIFQECIIPEGALRQLDIPIVSVTGDAFPTISWDAIENADNYIINFFRLTPQNRLGTAVFTISFDDDGSTSYSYTYDGDLFSQYSMLALGVVVREEVSACVLNRSIYYTVHNP